MFDTVRHISVVYSMKSALHFLENLEEEHVETQTPELNVLIALIPSQINILHKALNKALKLSSKGQPITEVFYKKYSDAVTIADTIVAATAN